MPGKGETIQRHTQAALEALLAQEDIDSIDMILVSVNLLGYLTHMLSRDIGAVDTVIRAYRANVKAWDEKGPPKPKVCETQTEHNIEELLRSIPDAELVKGAFHE